MNRLLKNKRQNTIILLFLIVFLICLSTIVYSAFSSTMTITGTAHARVEANVRITDFRLKSMSDATSSYEEFGKSHINTNINLTSSSSSITYYLEITNYGSVDVGILNITGVPDGVSYSIKDYKLHDKICNDDGKCNGFINKTYELTLTTTSSYSGNIVMNFDFRTYHNVIYTDINNKGYPTEVIDGGTLNITFMEYLNRVEVLSGDVELGFYKDVSDGFSVSFNNIVSNVDVRLRDYVARTVNGFLDSVGSEVCIGEECFYVVSNDGETVKLLSKYNLHVGDIYDDVNGTVPIANPTGIQDKTAIGWFEGYTVDNPIVGSIPFSSTNYWSSYVNSYPAYVYNSNSSLYSHIENYKSYLEGFGISIKDARVINLSELEGLGCSRSLGTCSSAPVWVYSTTYWTGVADASGEFFRIYSNGALGCSDITLPSRGVRPLIEISVDEIRPLVRRVSGDGSNVGDRICINNECFYTISSDSTSITMLTKYNLYVGYECETDAPQTCVAYENPTGLQDSTMLGHKINPRRGTVPFSSDTYHGENYSDYVGSRIEVAINNYKQRLNNFGIDVLEARAITIEELEELGCSKDDNSCNNAPKFISKTSYWTGSSYDSENVWRVGTTTFKYREYKLKSSNGVRPVIKIPKYLLGDTI